MKVIIVDKAEGKITATFEADSAVEHQIVSVCSLGETSCYLALTSQARYDPKILKAKDEYVTFGSFNIKVHDLVKSK